MPYNNTIYRKYSFRTLRLSATPITLWDYGNGCCYRNGEITLGYPTACILWFLLSVLPVAVLIKHFVTRPQGHVSFTDLPSDLLFCILQTNLKLESIEPMKL